jgi:hypothetical protein
VCVRVVDVLTGNYVVTGAQRNLVLSQSHIGSRRKVRRSNGVLWRPVCDGAATPLQYLSGGERLNTVLAHLDISKLLTPIRGDQQ